MENISGTALNSELIESVTWTNTAEDGNTGTIAYSREGTLASVVASAPALGTRSALFPDSSIVLVSRVFSTSGTGSVVKVTLTYKPLDEYELNSEKRDYTLNATSAQTSILLHPNYEKLSKSVLAVAKAYLDGTQPWQEVKARWEGNELIISSDNKNNDEETEDLPTVRFGTLIDKASSTSDAAADLFEKIRRGVTHYESTHQTWQVVQTSAGMNSSARGVGKISSPPGSPPTPHGSNWLLSGVLAAKTRSDSAWKITETYTASDPGTPWDSKLYS